jgi:O-antigen biosynthesis protein
MKLNSINHKDESYYSFIRTEIIQLIPPGAKRVLDVGCGTGKTGGAAKKLLKLNEIWGIEINESIGRKAKKNLDHVIIGDIEKIDFHCPAAYFDCIICADVLEHTRDPWGALRKLHKFLNPSGVIIASLPNLRHLIPVLKIIQNRLEYEPAGIFDHTHLRFFTLHTMKNMFKETGYTIVKIESNRSRSYKWTLLNIASLGLLRPFSIYQYIIVANSNKIENIPI